VAAAGAVQEAGRAVVGADSVAIAGLATYGEKARVAATKAG